MPLSALVPEPPPLPLPKRMMGFGANFLEYDGLLVVSPAELAVDLVSDFGVGAGCWSAPGSMTAVVTAAGLEPGRTLA